jgi:arabinan endo-1,5-alpha-L-arabinosidase
MSDFFTVKLRILKRQLILVSLFFCTTYMQSAAQSAIKNPVINQDFPDPTVMRFNGKYYGYATEGKDKLIQVAESSDLQHWKIIGGALDAKPAWAKEHFWAPHVLFDPVIKKYVLFYSAESTDTSTGKCLGIAFADEPTGPFIDKGSPLLCGESFVNIDPMAIIDTSTGKKLLYWGSAFKPIKVQEMNDDWTSFKKGSKAKDLVMPGKEKEYTRLIEGAWVDYHQGYYYLYYSGDNCCGEKANYAVLVARSTNATGPFTTFAEANGKGSSVVLEKNKEWIAPGHNSIVRDHQGRTWIAYHAIKAPNTGKTGRVFCISPLIYKNGWPMVVLP